MVYIENDIQLNTQKCSIQNIILSIQPTMDKPRMKKTLTEEKAYVHCVSKKNRTEINKQNINRKNRHSTGYNFIK